MPASTIPSAGGPGLAASPQAVARPITRRPPMTAAVLRAATQVLAHVPNFAAHGSKPSRVLPAEPETAQAFSRSLRNLDQATAYGPHQAYINAIHPRDLGPRPWFVPVGSAPAVTADRPGWSRFGPAGEIMGEEEFLGLMAAVDHFDLLTLDPALAARACASLATHPLAKLLPTEAVAKAAGDLGALAGSPGSVTVAPWGGDPLAVVRTAQADDPSLAAAVLFDNLSAKATASLALAHLIEKTGVDPASIDYVIGCGEEAIGDRYQRGGGNMAKAVAEVCGLSGASGADVKDFCAAFIPATVIAASLVTSGVFGRVAIVAGGSLAKLGMKFQGHLRHEMPIMEDVLGGAAALVEADDGRSPVIRLDSVGRHKVSAGGAAPQVMSALAIEPVIRLGLSATDVDDYATELHNPEITEPQGSGNVPDRNYRTIAALAAQQGHIERSDIATFVAERGMPGYSPTQGHLASALCYAPHAVSRLTTGDAGRVLLLAKGSLFLGRMCQLSDGMSVLLERNPKGW
ncbi:MAG: glycine/sarcosine/betaine reductase complex component C subunit beta [Acidimicrobiales bacterium]